MTRITGSRGRAESGSTLAVMLATLLPVIALVTVFFTGTTTELDRHRVHKNGIRATWRALAALEAARNQVINSAYDAAGNLYLRDALAQTGTAALRMESGQAGFLAFNVDNGRRETFTNPNVAVLPPELSPYFRLLSIDLEDDFDGEADDATDKAVVYVARLTGSWCVLESEASVMGTRRTARVLVRERDPFTRFSIFIDRHYQGIAGSPKGDIHTNRTLQIFFPDAVFDDFVSARDGFQWMIGAGWGNTTFNAGYAAPTAAIPMPGIAAIQNLAGLATGSFNVGTGYDNTEITFDDDRVMIRARRIATGTMQTLHNGFLPGNGLIYVKNGITKLEGDLAGRVTVVTEGSTTITNSLRYVDADGDAAMVNANDPENYATNPDYDGNSALGIISYGSVTYALTVPNDLEVNAAVFTSTGTVGIPGLTYTANGAYVSGYNPAFRKANLAVLGSTISSQRFTATVVNGSGVVLSGFDEGAIEYDRNLLNDPPPHFLEIDRPLFKAVEIIEDLVDA